MSVGVERSSDSPTRRQLELIRRMGELDPPVRIRGGFAEDALLAGTVLRPHADVDWLFPRREYDLRVAQARDLGFGELEVWGDSAPGQPFYLYGENGEKQLRAMAALKARFFPDRSDEELLPRLESLAAGGE